MYGKLQVAGRKTECAWASFTFVNDVVVTYSRMPAKENKVSFYRLHEVVFFPHRIGSMKNFVSLRNGDALPEISGKVHNKYLL